MHDALECFDLLGLEKYDYKNQVNEGVEEYTLYDKDINEDDNKIYKLLRKVIQIMHLESINSIEKAQETYAKTTNETVFSREDLKEHMKSFHKLLSRGYFNKEKGIPSMVESYICLTIVREALSKMEDEIDVKLYSNKNKKDDKGQELEKFYSLMKRYPNRDDYKMYEDTMRQLDNSIKSMKGIANIYENSAKKMGYWKSSYIIQPSITISLKIINSIIQSNESYKDIT